MISVPARSSIDFERDGFCLAADVLCATQRRALIDVLAQSGSAQARRGSATYGARNLLQDERIKHLASSPPLTSLASELTGGAVRAVRALFFDKTPDANWHVPWHQDVVVALAARCDLPVWGPWTTKAGVAHAEAPVDVLAHMVTLRLHLDDCGADNGPLRVLPRSHARGRLKRDEITQLCAESDAQICVAPAGSAFAMRPLLVHASSSAQRPGHRRVLHLEYAPDDALPPPLAWAN